MWAPHNLFCGVSTILVSCCFKLEGCTEQCHESDSQRALERGEFRLLGPRQDNPPDMRRICSVALDIASGMAVLHKRNVVHGGAQS